MEHLSVWQLFGGNLKGGGGAPLLGTLKDIKKGPGNRNLYP